MASRRIANVLLSVVLVLGLMPAPAFAGETGGSDAIEGSVPSTSAAQAPAAADNEALSDKVNMDSDANDVAADIVDVSAGMESDVPAVSTLVVNAPSADDAASFAEATPISDWRRSGTCEWTIDATGLLTVRPLGDGASGELADWGSSYDGAPWYYQRESIRSAVIEPGVSAKTCAGMFYGCSSLASLGLSGLDTSTVTDMHCMFYRCSSLTTLDLSSLDTSNVTDMTFMFNGCSSLTTIYASFDFAKSGRNLREMFSDCRSLVGGNGTSFKNENAANAGAVHGNSYARVDGYNGPGYFTVKGLSEGWKLCGTCEWKIDGEGLLTVRPLDDGDSGVLADWGGDAPWYANLRSIKSAVIKPGVSARTCRAMFDGCANMTSCDLSGLNTSSVADMVYMFRKCSSLTTLDPSSLDTSQVTNMDSMFSWCSLLTILDLSGFDTSQVANMDSMFYNCSSLKTIYVSKLFTTAKVESPNNTFYQCTSLAGGAGTEYDPSIINASRACIDLGTNAPGYFTGKHAKLDGDMNGSGTLNAVDAQIVYDIATTDFYKDRQDYADMCTRADVTWDNEVDATDAFAIQYAALRGW